MSVRLAVATEDFGTELKEAVAVSARCPVQGLRLNARTEVRADKFSDSALRQLRHFITEQQMTVAGLMFPSRHALHDPENLDRRIESIRAAMTLVRRLGTSELLVRCGRIPNPQPVGGAAADASDSVLPTKKSTKPTNSDVDSLKNPFSFAPSVAVPHSVEPTAAQQFATLCEIVSDLAAYGSHVGCTLQLQMAVFDTDRIRQLLDAVKSGPIRLVYDPATAVMTGRSPVNLFRDLYSDFGYIRGRDALADMDGAGIEVTLGEGKVDWVELLPTIAETEYEGWFCVERSGGEQRAEDVRLGVSYISQLLINGPN